MVGSFKVPFVEFLNAEPHTGFHRGSRLLCKIATAVSYGHSPANAAGAAVRRSSDMELNIEEKSVSDMVAQGIALGGTAS
jgi:hypothetical protein